MYSGKIRKLSDSPTVRKKTGDVGYELDSFVDDFWPVKQPDKNLCPLIRRGECYNRLLDFIRESEKPEYADDIKMMISQSPVIKIGESFDVLSLLSFKGQSNYLVRNNGDRVDLNKDTFQGKYVMVCCFHVPIHRLHEDASTFQFVANICYEMFDSFDDDFEIVLVAKMNTKYNNRRDFCHFLSAFPPSCLVVPFDDPKRRDYICCYLDVTLPCNCFIVDGSSIALLNKYPDFAMNDGADTFPFCPNPSAKDVKVWKISKATQLQKFLGSIASDVLYKINQEGGWEEVSFSRLNEKVVGLYLWSEGTCCITEKSFIHTLHEVYEKCRDNQQEFEIVVVYLPFVDCLPPEVYQGKIDKFMEKNKISWWGMPFNNSKCRKIWEICGYWPDKLVIVGPHNGYVDLYGGEVLRKFGSDAYPFSREGLVDNHVKLLRELTLESLLTSELCDYVLRGDTQVTVAALQPRNILLYFGCFKDTVLFENLQEWYGEIKTKNPNFEVIYVRRNNKDFDASNDYNNKAIDPALSDLPWLVHPFQTDHSRSLEKKLFPQVTPFDTLVEFGIDGRVCSVDTQNLLRAKGPDGFPFEYNLRGDVWSRLESFYLFMESME